MDNVKELCAKIRELCEEYEADFLFITEGKSVWSITSDGHLKDVAAYHVKNEPIE